MSFYSLGKNELYYLHQKEAQIKEELKKLEKSSDNICSFKEIILKNEMKKIQNKLKILTFGYNPDGDDIA